MAEAAIVSKATENLTSVLVQKLFQEVTFLTSFREDFEFLCEELISIKALLRDAGDKRNSTSVCCWLDRLEEFLLDAVDIVEECGAGRKLWNPIFRCKMGRRINKLKKRIGKIHRSTKYLISLTSALHVNERMQIINAYNPQHKREISNSIIEESQIVGMKDQIDSITELICQDNGPPVIVIEGMGGQGKTLLLQHIYNSQKVRDGFNRRVWLPVSQKFSVTRLLFEILKQLSNDPKEIEKIEKDIVDEKKELSIQMELNIKFFVDLENADQEIENKLREKLRSKIDEQLQRKRSLFAIDDVWDQNLFLKNIMLPMDNIKMVITTRDKRVGEAMPHHHIYPMTSLSDQNSLELFFIHAFPDCQKNPPKELKSLACQIAKKCGGLPLALKTMGSYMARIKKLPNDWELILRQLNEAEAITEGVTASLRLSYQALPDHVQPCFLYCSVFSKNTPIKAECLVHAWIAEGFISTSTQEAAEDAYDVGCSYLDELIDLSLIEVSQIGGDERVKYCKMHDLLHDLALSESLKATKCLLEPGGGLKKLPVERCLGLRRISLIKNNISNIKEAVQCPGLRTLVLSYNHRLESISSSFFNNLRYLTVLDLNRTLIRSLPKSIGKLKYLKFLNLSGTFISKLPKSFSGLRHLQFLDVSYCSKLKRLHSGIGEHKFMLHLNAEGCPSLRSLPFGISNLISLQTLKGARVSMREKAANALQLSHLEGLTLLQHLAVTIDYSGHATQEEVIPLKAGIFQGMTKMRTLELSFNSSHVLDLSNDMALMERLTIVHLHRCVLPKWIFQLKNLMELKLDNAERSDYRGLEEIPNLKILHLSKDKNCVEFPEEFGKAGAFPKLQTIIIEEFEDLKKIPPLNDDAMPNLKNWRTERCYKLVDMPERFKRLERIKAQQNLEHSDLPYEHDLSSSLKDIKRRFQHGLRDCCHGCCFHCCCCCFVCPIVCCMAGLEYIFKK